MSALELAGREVHARALLYSVVLGLDRSRSLPWASQGSVERLEWELRLLSHVGSHRQVEGKWGLVCRNRGESLTAASFSCLAPSDVSSSDGL